MHVHEVGGTQAGRILEGIKRTLERRERDAKVPLVERQRRVAWHLHPHGSACGAARHGFFSANETNETSGAAVKLSEPPHLGCPPAYTPSDKSTVSLRTTPLQQLDCCCAANSSIKSSPATCTRSSLFSLVHKAIILARTFGTRR